jgi:hypothetical protein
LASIQWTASLTVAVGGDIEGDRAHVAGGGEFGGGGVAAAGVAEAEVDGVAVVGTAGGDGLADAPVRAGYQGEARGSHHGLKAPRTTPTRQITCPSAM